MEKKIQIPYNIVSRQMDTVVSVSYNIERLSKEILINCNVLIEEGGHNSWLSVRKFQLKATHINGYYSLIFNDRNMLQALDATLFIERVYIAIMKAEKLAVQPELEIV